MKIPLSCYRNLLPCMHLIVAFLLCGIAAKAQLEVSRQVAVINKLDSITTLPSSYFTRIENKYADLNQQLTRQTEKYLSRLEKGDEKIQRQLSRIQGTVMQPLQKTKGFYSQLIAKVQNVSKTDLSVPKGIYLPLVDSVKGSLDFLSQQQALQKGAALAKEKFAASLGEVKQLQARLQVSDDVKSFIAQRKEQMRLSIDQLQNTAGKYTKLPASLIKDWKAYQQQAYYYSAQVAEYKTLLNTPDRLIEKGLGLPLCHQLTMMILAVKPTLTLPTSKSVVAIRMMAVSKASPSLTWERFLATPAAIPGL